MSRKNARVLSRMVTIALVAYAVCALWVHAPILGYILTLPVRADLASGLILGVFLTRR